jgi:hypothetical protein
LFNIRFGHAPHPRVSDLLFPARLSRGGRHARLATDLLLRSMGCEPFSWGGGELVDQGEIRARYITALQAADEHDIAPLLVFVRS